MDWFKQDSFGVTLTVWGASASAAAWLYRSFFFKVVCLIRIILTWQVEKIVDWKTSFLLKKLSGRWYLSFRACKSSWHPGFPWDVSRSSYCALFWPFDSDIGCSGSGALLLIKLIKKARGNRNDFLYPAWTLTTCQPTTSDTLPWNAPCLLDSSRLGSTLLDRTDQGLGLQCRIVAVLLKMPRTMI